MEDSEVVRIAEASVGNRELKRLYHTHLELDSKLHDLGKRWYLSPQEVEEVKRLKFLKAHGKRKMFEILDRLEEEE